MRVARGLIILALIIATVTAFFPHLATTSESDEGIKGTYLTSEISIGGCLSRDCRIVAGYGKGEDFYADVIALYSDSEYAYVVLREKGTNISIIKYNLSRIHSRVAPPAGISEFEWDVKDDQVLATGALAINVSTEPGSYYPVTDFNGTHLLVASGYPRGSLLILVDVRGDIPAVSKVINVTSSELASNEFTIKDVILLDNSTAAYIFEGRKLGEEVSNRISIIKLNLSSGEILWQTPLTRDGYLPSVRGGPTCTWDIAEYSRSLWGLANGDLVATVRLTCPTDYYNLLWVVTLDRSNGSVKLSKALFPVSFSELEVVPQGYIYSYSRGRIVKINLSSGEVVWGTHIPFGRDSNNRTAYFSTWGITLSSGKLIAFLKGLNFPINDALAVINITDGTPQYLYLTDLEGGDSITIHGLVPSKGWLLIQQPPLTGASSKIMFVPVFDPPYEFNSSDLDVRVEIEISSNIPETNFSTVPTGLSTTHEYSWNEVNYEGLSEANRVYLLRYPPPEIPSLRNSPDIGLYRLGTYLGESPHAVIQDSDGNIYVFAHVFTAYRGSMGDLLALKIAPNGSIVVNKYITGVVHPSGISDAVVGHDGFIYLVTNYNYFPYYARGSRIIKVDPNTLEPVWVLNPADTIVSAIPHPSSDIIYLVGVDNYICYSSGTCNPSPNGNLTLVVLDVSNPDNPSVITRRYYRFAEINGVLTGVGGVLNYPYLYLVAFQNISSPVGGGLISFIIKVNVESNYQAVNVAEFSYQATWNFYVLTASVPLKVLKAPDSLIIVGQNIYYDIANNKTVNEEAAAIKIPYDLSGIHWCKVLSSDVGGNNYTDVFFDAYPHSSGGSLYLYLTGYGRGFINAYGVRKPFVLKVDPVTGNLIWGKVLNSTTDTYAWSIHATDSRVVAGFFPTRINLEQKFNWVGISGYKNCWNPSILDSPYTLVASTQTKDSSVYQPFYYVLNEKYLTKGGYDVLIASLDPEGGIPLPIPEATHIALIVAITAILLTTYYLRRK